GEGCGFKPSRLRFPQLEPLMFSHGLSSLEPSIGRFPDSSNRLSKFCPVRGQPRDGSQATKSWTTNGRPEVRPLCWDIDNQPKSTSPNIRAQTGLSTPDLICNQAALLRDDTALPFLTGGLSNVADMNPVTPTPKTADQPNHHSSNSTHQTIPASFQHQQPTFPTPSPSATSLPHHMRHHNTHFQNPVNTSFSSSNPTVQPPLTSPP
ncbi:hypothetical protein PCASD_26918, partial [Puccinia coronata f. sp. avenae]